MANELTTAEQTSLQEHEGTIHRHAQAFVATGLALAAIRDDKLYRATHDTFEAYCHARWEITDVHARRLIRGAEVVAKTEPIGSVLPASESQARPLTMLPLEEVEGVWRDVVSVAPRDEAGDPNITAALVQHTVDLHKGDLPKTLQATTGDAAPAAEVDDEDTPCSECGCDECACYTESNPAIAEEELPDDDRERLSRRLREFHEWLSGVEENDPACVWRSVDHYLVNYGQESTR